ncbi:MAG: hypothetical protein ACREID_02560, partial [Planctomycetota bacterium]
LRDRADGAAALRLRYGAAALVAGDAPVHAGVDGTDLVVRLEGGACFLRRTPGDAICMRGTLHLELADGTRFQIPEGERLPAACTSDPRTAPAHECDVELGWYYLQVYAECVRTEIEWDPDEDGRLVAGPLAAAPGAFLFLRFVPAATGELEVSFGGGARAFPVRRDRPFSLRLLLSDLGPGPRLQLTVPPGTVQASRISSYRARHGTTK